MLSHASPLPANADVFPVVSSLHPKLRPEIQSTPYNSNFQRKSKTVRVIGSLRQTNGSKEMSKWMGRKGNQATKYTGMDTEFELE